MLPSLLATRRFLPLFLTQFLGAFNDNLFKNAIVMLITFRIAAEADAPKLTAMAAGLFILPFFLFSALAGQLADKFDKAKLVRYVKISEIVILALSVPALLTGALWPLMFLLFFMGVHSSFFGPLKYSILPEHLKREELLSGNAYIEAGTFLAILLGTIAGGLLTLQENGTVIVSATAIAIAFAGLFAARSVPACNAYAPALKLSFNIFASSWQVVRFALSNAQRRRIILSISWFWLVGSVFLTQFPSYVRIHLGGNEHIVTFFLMLFSVGIALGSLLCRRLMKGTAHLRYVTPATFGMGFFMIDLLSATPVAADSTSLTLTAFLQTLSGWRITADLLLIALFGGVYTVPLYTLLQQESEEESRARIIAATNVMNALFMVGISVACMALFAHGISIPAVFSGLGALTALTGLAFRKRR